ncbi:folic acid synthesis protein Fol1p [Diutina catenulata]
MSRDRVFINQLAATAVIGNDAWGRPTPQPLAVSLEFNTDFAAASASDDLKHSLNYAVISRNISEFADAHKHQNFGSLANFSAEVAAVAVDTSIGGGSEATVTVESKKSEIRAGSVSYVTKRGGEAAMDQVLINQLRVLTVIGVFTFERLQRQVVDLDLQLSVAGAVPIREIIEAVVAYTEAANFKTVEALVARVGQLIVETSPEVKEAVVKVTKPNAIAYTEGVGVSSVVGSGDFAGEPRVEIPSQAETGFNLPVHKPQAGYTGPHTAYLAIGSNEGVQMRQIRQALDLLPTYGIDIVATSSMYLSKPMYYKDQPDFYNAVIKVAFADHSPHELLRILKEIEYGHIDRVKEFDNGPRSIDLDVILYDQISINTDDLVVPHPRMLERTFVLQPLCELIGPDETHPVTAEPIHNHLRVLLNSESESDLQESALLQQIIPLPRIINSDFNPLKFDQVHNNHPTLLMGILNTTPDSFSDGGSHYHKDASHIEQAALKQVEEGATIIDIGGVSTRPGSKEPSEAEELDRVVPVVEAIRKSSNPLLRDVVISVDTYRASVARACLAAGADIINDISMGLYDPDMFQVVAETNCAYVMNHTRGTPATMSKLTTYKPNDDPDVREQFIDPARGVVATSDDTHLIPAIGRELAQQVRKAFAAGVRKWQVIIDPGVGFAKNMRQNLTILRNASQFKQYSVTTPEGYISYNGIALLVGTSRKRFLGTLLDQPVASDRLIGTTATTVACIQQQCDIIRVHDVKENHDAAVVADALYRNVPPTWKSRPSSPAPE